jgi:dihydropteroate synthase
MNIWKTSKRTIEIGTRAVVMGILNTTPDSFSDGGRYLTTADALRRVEIMVAEGADIIDVGGESTRANGQRVDAEVELSRVIPIISAIAQRFDVPLSVDTSKGSVARAAIEAGAEIINDISGMTFDPGMTEIAAETKAGVVLMHLNGNFETMHQQLVTEDIVANVTEVFKRYKQGAADAGISSDSVVLDIGIGFGKTLDQNLSLIARIDELCDRFPKTPILIGTSRKSFISKALGEVPTEDRLPGSLASAVIAFNGGARIFRVHDVKETVQALRIVERLADSRIPERLRKGDLK